MPSNQFLAQVVHDINDNITFIAVLSVMVIGFGGACAARWLLGREMKLGRATVAGFLSVPAMLMAGGMVYVVAPYFAGTQASVTEDSKSVATELVSTTDEAEADSSKPTDETGFVDSALPAWAKSTTIENGSSTLVTVSSGRYATIEEAEQEAVAVAVAAVKEDFDRHQESKIEWTIPIELVKNHCFRDRHVEKIHQDLGPISADMYQLYLQVKLSPETRAKFTNAWESSVVGNRLWVLGSAAGLLTLMFGTISSYFRLDSATNGAYRNRLKFAALSVVAAGGAIAWTLLPPV